jgi:Zn-dependent peptidase ImmA (M78 family)/transcriptional regulator with XRE-family HTH domain
MTIANRLAEARARLDLTLAQVSEKTGIGSSSLSDFENGKRDPSSVQLVTLARFYHVPVGFFYGEVELPTEKVLWRHKPSSPSAEDCEARFVELCRWYKDLEDWAEEDLRALLPKFDVSDGELRRSEVMKLAERCRSALELGNHPAITLLRTLEDAAGVKVFHLPLGPDGNAACAVGEFGVAVLLNSDNGPRQRVFDLAHELYRLLTWDSRDQHNVPEAAEELAADRFAAHLLVPMVRLSEAMGSMLARPRIGLTDLALLARRFDVPTDAVLRVLADIGDVDENIVNKAIARCRKLDLETDKSDSPPERPRRFQDLAVKAFQKQATSITKLARYLGVRTAEAMQLLRFAISEEEDIVLA